MKEDNELNDTELEMKISFVDAIITKAKYTTKTSERQKLLIYIKKAKTLLEDIEQNIIEEKI